MISIIKKLIRSKIGASLCGLFISGTAMAAAPSGNYIINRSTNPSQSSVILTSATINTQVALPFLTAGQCLSMDSNKRITSQACASGATSTLLMTTGTISGFSSVISSPTAIINLNNAVFTSQLTGSATNFVGLNASSVTLQGNTFNTASHLVQLDVSAALPAVSATNLTNIPAANITGQVPAANLSNAVINQNTLQSGSTFYVSSGSISGKLTITQNDLTNNPSALVITSTGTGIPVLVDVNGFPGATVQNQQGGVTIRNINNVNGPGVPLLVLVDSTTDTQSGVGVFELWSNNPNHNDPLMWIHRTSSNSSPEMRLDSPSPNFEVVNTSTANAVGYGKWEPFAIASQGVNLQVNSRAYDNTTFERVGEWRPRSKGTGLAIYPTINGENSNPSSTSGGQLIFITTNTKEVGIKGPTSTTASWYWTLPDTFNNLGNVLYQSTNGPDRKLAFTADGTEGQVLTYHASAAPTWGSPAAAGSTYSLQYKNSSGTLSGSGFFLDINQQQLLVGTTTGAEGAIAMQEAAANGTSYVAIKSSASLSGSTTWIWPASDGSAGDVLVTRGGGSGGHVLEWQTATGSPAGSTFAMQYKAGASSFGGSSKVFHDSATGGLSLQTTGQIEFFQADNAHYVGFKSSDTGMSGSTIWVLPTGDGTANQVLATAGAPSHNLSFVSAGLLTSSQTWSGTNAFSKVGIGQAVGSNVLNITALGGPSGDGVTVSGASNPTMRLSETNSSASSIWSMASSNNQFVTGASTGDIVMGSENSSPAQNIFFLNSASQGPALTITKNYQVGIGTTTARSKLDVYGDVNIRTQNPIRLYDSSNSNYVALRASASVTTSTYTWPSADGSANSGLITNGSGNLSFTPVGILNSTQTWSGTNTFQNHIITNSTAPVISSCGSSPSVSGGDNAFTITVGAGATACTATFATAAATSAPTCVVSEQTGSVTNVLSYTVSTSAITVSQTGLGGNKLDVICSFHN